MNKKTANFLMMTVLAGLLLFGVWFVATRHFGSEYHLVWSKANLRWIFVDKDGNP